MDWRSSASDEAKKRMMWAAWGDSPPDYCYYHLPDGVVVDEIHIDTTFFLGSIPGTGSKEIHKSDEYSGSGLVRVETPAPIQVLRIRSSKVVPPPAITMNGIRCPLIQFGQASDTRAGADGAPVTVNFIEEWGWGA